MHEDIIGKHFGYLTILGINKDNPRRVDVYCANCNRISSVLFDRNTLNSVRSNL